MFKLQSWKVNFGIIFYIDTDHFKSSVGLDRFGLRRKYHILKFMLVHKYE